VVAGGAAPHPLVRRACGSGYSRTFATRGGPTWPRSSWTGRSCAPAGRRRAQKGPRGQALGRSRGGFGTKARAACDGSGRPLAFASLPGQAAELKAAPALLAAVVALGVVLRAVCDQAYSSAAWRALIQACGAEPVAPANPTRKSAPPHDPLACRRRHKVENLRARPKEWRAVATRYEKTAASYLGDLHLAAAFEWLAVP
jgi:transposase